MKGLSAVLCLLTVTACSGSSPSAPTPFSRDFVMAPGQTISVPEGGIAMRFEGVSGDSRCPADAMCIQGGDAIVKVTVVPARGDSQAYALHTGDMRPVAHEDLTIALVELTPYPFSSTTIAPEDYRATVKVSR